MPYTHLTENERVVISHFAAVHISLREIARCLGRDHSSISREIKRNSPADAPDAIYSYVFSHQIAEKRQHIARSHCRQKYQPLINYVEEKLKLEWPPEVIVARLKADYPNDERMRVSHETIYHWVYLDASQNGDLHGQLRRRHKKRRRQTRYGSGRRFIPGRVSIDERPAIVNTRERFGDWEGDTVEGAKGTGCLATHVERKSRFLVAAKLPDKKAATMNDQSIKAFWKIPRTMRLTLTVDNGREFAKFKELETKTGLKVYFADPYSAWERGTNENTNGLLRYYFPKGIDFRNISDQELAIIVDRVNHRPRKCLSYRTPYEVFHQASHGALGS